MMVSPPMQEPRRVAAILDKVDHVRRERQASMALTDDLLQSIFLDMFGDPASNPHGFDTGKVGQLVLSASHGSTAKASDVSGEFPVLRMNNITARGGWDFAALKHVDLPPGECDRFLARKGDVLFNRTNTLELVGKSAVFDEAVAMVFASNLVRLRMNELGNAYYLAGYLNCAHGKAALRARATSLVGMANISAQELQEMPILLPPVALQSRYARVAQAVRDHQKTQASSLAEIGALASALSLHGRGTV